MQLTTKRGHTKVKMCHKHNKLRRVGFMKPMFITCLLVLRGGRTHGATHVSMLKAPPRSLAARMSSPMSSLRASAG